MNIGPMGINLFHVDRRTQRHDDAHGGFSEFFESAFELHFVTSVLFVCGIRLAQQTATFLRRFIPVLFPVSELNQYLLL